MQNGDRFVKFKINNTFTYVKAKQMRKIQLHFNSVRIASIDRLKFTPDIKLNPESI